MIIDRIYETQNLLSLYLVSFLVWLRTYQHPYKFTSVESSRDNSSVDGVTILWAGRPKPRGYIPCRGKRFISVPKRPHQVWFLS